jgi:hypothetical protein
MAGKSLLSSRQCCGSGFGIRYLFDPGIRDGKKPGSGDADPGWKNSDPGSGMEKFGSGMEKIRIRDSGFGINIPDPQTLVEGL